MPFTPQHGIHTTACHSHHGMPFTKRNDIHTAAWQLHHSMAVTPQHGTSHHSMAHTPHNTHSTSVAGCISSKRRVTYFTKASLGQPTRFLNTEILVNMTYNTSSTACMYDVLLIIRVRDNVTSLYEQKIVKIVFLFILNTYTIFVSAS